MKGTSPLLGRLISVYFIGFHRKLTTNLRIIYNIMTRARPRLELVGGEMGKLSMEAQKIVAYDFRLVGVLTVRK